eukprot:GHVN01073706.1.p1 GENE.GHVN01073706.1~~GHVN01073706.1.p1  ORF type:complete len:317 (-),score=76.56 GHVN01073706.1:611-1561(-)
MFKVGTLHCMAPEVVELGDDSHQPDAAGGESPYTYGVDLWAFGCLVYRLFTTHAPFSADSEGEVRRKIKEIDFRIPDDFPPAAGHLVSSLLVRNPRERLGYDDIDEIKRHEFFIGVDFDTIHNTPPETISKLQAESMSNKRRPRDVEVVSDFDFGPSSLECTPEIGQPFKSNAVSYPQIDEFELQVSIEPSCEPEQPPHSPDSPFLLPQSSPTHTLPTSPPTAVTRDSLSSHISTQSTSSSSTLAQANYSELDINFPVRRRRRPVAKSRRVRDARGGAAREEIDHGGEGGRGEEGGEEDSLETLHSPQSSKSPHLP